MTIFFGSCLRTWYADRRRQPRRAFEWAYGLIQKWLDSAGSDAVMTWHRVARASPAGPIHISASLDAGY